MNTLRAYSVFPSNAAAGNPLSTRHDVPDTRVVPCNDSDPTETRMWAYRPAVSGDGRFVAFHASRQANGPVERVLLFDRESESLTDVGAGKNASLSADGRLLAFSRQMQIHVYDVSNGETRLMSVGTDGQPSDGGCDRPALSADGEYVAFESSGVNLGATAREIFRQHVSSGTIQRVTVTADGGHPDRFSGAPQLSADGQVVAFESTATNLVEGCADYDVYVRDMRTGVTECVSAGPTGGISAHPALSADGRFVAFSSSKPLGAHGNQVYVRDRETGTTRCASVSSTGEPGDGTSNSPSISADGRYVAFTSTSTNLDGAKVNPRGDVFVHDLHTGQTRRASVGDDGGNLDVGAVMPALSADGGYVAFESTAANAVPEKRDRISAIFATRNPVNDDFKSELLQRAAEEVLRRTEAPGGHIVRADSYVEINGVRVPVKQ